MSAGHIRPRGPGSWEIKFDLGRDPITGKRVVRYRTVRGTRRDAQRELRALLSAVDKGQHVDPSKMTVGQWLQQWLEEVRTTAAPKSHENYAVAVRAHLAPRLGAIRLDQLAPVHVQKAVGEMLASGLSPRSVRHYTTILRVALQRARALLLIASDPMAGVARPRVEPEEMVIPSQEGLAKLLDAARGTRLYAPIVLALGTGLRRGEVLGLQWGDLNLDAGTLRVERALEDTKGGPPRLKDPKTTRSRRTVALSESVVGILHQHRVQQLEERMLLGLGRPSHTALVFADLEGRPVKPNGFGQHFAQLVQRAGMRPFTFHGLRHVHATELLRAGVNPRVAADRLGHANIGITLGLYSHVVPGMQEEAAARVDAGLKAILGS